MALIHGGDWAGYKAEYRTMPLDFSTNISPLGLPESVRAAAAAALAEADRYPDPLCRELRAALAAYHHVSAERIVCGAGAAELIHRLCRTLRPGRAALTAPGFAEYERALQAGSCSIERITLREEDGFRLPEPFPLSPDCELIFLCNPNNPTGVLAGRGSLLPLLRRCREYGTVLVADECFMDFCEDADACSLIPALREFPRLVILRAFTKTWAMAGLRLGYALCGDADLAARLQDCGQPWAVSNLAQAAGIAALREQDYVNRLRALISSERERLRPALENLGLRVIPGSAGFLLFFCGAPGFSEKLRERGILIRDCANFPGLGEGWYRTAVRGHDDNDRLLRAMEEVLGHG